MMDGMKRALDTRKVDMRALKVASSTILTLAIMVAIFSFSAQSGGESGSLSDAVARMLASAFVGGFDAEEYPGCGSRLCQDGEAIGWAVDDSASDAENQMRMELWIAAIG